MRKRKGEREEIELYHYSRNVDLGFKIGYYLEGGLEG